MGNWLARVKKMRVVMLGLDASGKTTMLYHMKLGEAVPTIPTIGFNVEMLHIDKVEVTCWDVGCREKGKGLWYHYFAMTDGFIFMVDSTDRERICEAINDLIRYIVSDYRTYGTMIMVLANKQDVEGALSVQAIEDLLQPKCSFRGHTIFVVPCCALDWNHITQAFSYFAHQLCLNKEGKAKRGLISIKERESQMSESNKSSPELTLKTLLRRPIEYFKSYFK